MCRLDSFRTSDRFSSNSLTYSYAYSASELRPAVIRWYVESMELNVAAKVVVLVSVLTWLLRRNCTTKRFSGSDHLQSAHSSKSSQELSDDVGLHIIWPITHDPLTVYGAKVATYPPPPSTVRPLPEESDPNLLTEYQPSDFTDPNSAICQPRLTFRPIQGVRPRLIFS
jgi:hypothetical protein